jgi:RNA processing factor Prp31
MREELDESIFQLLQLGEKFIEMDNWKEESFIEVTSHIYHDLEVKEDALKKLKEVFQETKKSSSIATIKASTMTKENMVNSPSNTLGDFKKHTKGIGSKIMSKMSYDDQGIYKECQGIFIPIVA